MPNQIIYLHYNNEGLPARLSDEFLSIDYNKHNQSALKESLLNSGGIIIPNDSSAQHLDSTIICTLRHVFKLKQPILVVSDEKMNSWFEINSSEYPEYLRYLQDPSISYLTKSKFLQFSGNEIINCFEEGLDDILLKELCSYVYDDFGYMINRLNDLNSYIKKSNDLKLVSSSVNRYFPELKRIVERKMNILDRGDEYLSQIYILLERSDEKSAESTNILIGEIIKLMEDYSHFLLQEQRRYDQKEKGEVVFIGNHRETIREVEDHFFSQGVICKGTSCPNEVVEIIKNDRYNKITVVISESRYYSEHKKIQRKQLEHLNKIISNLPNMVAMIILTEPEVSFFQNNNISNISIPKNLIIDHPNGFHRLSNTFFELDKKVREMINNLPGFNQRQKILYKQHRGSPDYSNVEQALSKKAELIVTALAEGNSAFELELPILNGKLNNKNPTRNLENFRNVLLARRIALGLCQMEEEILKANYPTINKKLTNIERWGIIYNSLKFGSLKLQSNTLPDEAEISTVIIRNLKLSMKARYKGQSGLQSRLTQEESSWMKEIIKNHYIIKMNTEGQFRISKEGVA
ncbi:MAG: hypothetical protein KTR26_18475 [Flammeovirgaceae bacterium]|nr:hypothetical protein [Flammeovirgaceae bacterium]